MDLSNLSNSSSQKVLGSDVFCAEDWTDVSPHGCFFIDSTNLRDFFMTMEYCESIGGYMVEFLTQVNHTELNNSSREAIALKAFIQG